MKMPESKKNESPFLFSGATPVETLEIMDTMDYFCVMCRRNGRDDTMWKIFNVLIIHAIKVA